MVRPLDLLIPLLSLLGLVGCLAPGARIVEATIMYFTDCREPAAIQFEVHMDPPAGSRYESFPLDQDFVPRWEFQRVAITLGPHELVVRELSSGAADAFRVSISEERGVINVQLVCPDGATPSLQAFEDAYAYASPVGT